jgi:peptide/nickel transport system substrate-binding protein
MRKAVLLTISAVLVLGLLWCGGAMAAGDIKQLRVAAPWGAKGWEPARSGYIFSRMDCLQRLTMVDENGKLVGQLAESWSVADDKLTWTFNIRQGVKFHDGTPLTADWVAKSLTRAHKGKSILAKTPFESVRAKGQNQIEIKTSKPFSPLAAYLCHYSTAIMAPASFNDKNEAVNAIGTGPYKLIDSKAGKLFKFEAFQDYWSKKPSIAKVSYHAAPKGETRSNMIRAGQAEMSFTLAPMDAAKLKRGGQAKVVLMTIPRTRLIKLNCNMPLFKDVKVRKAISMAINRQAIAKSILRNPPSAATQLLAPGVSQWHDKNLAPLSYDPEEAARLLDQAGWKLGSDGIRAKDGEKAEFELLTYSSRPMLPLVAAAIQDMLGRLGIKVNIKVGESGNISDRHHDGSLQAGLVARNFAMIPEPIANLATDFGHQGGGLGAMGWSSKKMVQAIDSYFATFDQAKLGKLRHEILSILQDELPVIPVTWYENIVAYNSGLKQVRVDPLEINYHLSKIKCVK